jgi:SanA protein
MLLDRLNQGIALYEAEVSDRLLMSGDHGQTDYDEVNVMKRIAVEAGIPSSHVFMDHAGFSTYESLIRARDVFGVKRLIIVSQKEHLYRALMIADELGSGGHWGRCTGNPLWRSMGS